MAPPARVTDYKPDWIDPNDRQFGHDCLSYRTAKHESPPSFVPTPIAICGIAVRLPGGIRDATDFWNLLVSGTDARAPVPYDRYRAEGFGSELGDKESVPSTQGYFIDEDLSALDTSFFTLSKQELEKTDPQQRQLLEVTRECLENAGETVWDGESIGCYVGTFSEDWQRITSRDSQQIGRYTLTGYNDMMLANRVSYEFNLKGPSVVIKTGCSSSMVALHQACRAIQTGDCNAALVAGVNLIMTPAMTAIMISEGVVSKDSSSKTFDAAANGYARGEAINALYIKSLDDAIRDGNPVHAVIRNTATNCGGHGSNLVAPNEHSQEAMIRKAYDECGLDPRDTPFVECHGTGTLIGDRVEATAVGRVFSDRGTFIGSVKPNLGHSEGASGITSLIKAILALQHGTVPPNIKFDRPNPHIPFQKYKLTVPTRATAWPEDRPRRISVNSFGIGGSNAHSIIEAYDEASAMDKASPKAQRSSATLLFCSANTSKSLQNNMDSYQAFVQANPQSLSDMAYTLAFRRQHLPHRAFIVAENAVTLRLSPPIKIPSVPRQLIMVFSGQGAQWPRMGAGLLTSDSKFLKDVRAMDKVLQDSPHPPAWSIELELLKDSSGSNLRKAEFAQPLCTAIQIAVVNAFSRVGVCPTAVIGHSSGEIAAAYASGFLSQRLAILTSYYRGLATKEQVLRGGMAVLGMSSAEVESFLCPGVVISCENSPDSTTISGDLDQIQRCVADVQQRRPDVLARLLQVDQAYHSYHMKAVAGRYHSLLISAYAKEPKALHSLGPKPRFFSSVYRNQILESNQISAEYWVDNLVLPVLFASAVTNVTNTLPDCIFLEIGPHSTLAGPLRQTCRRTNTELTYVPSMMRNQDCNVSLLSAFGQLFQHGFAMKMENMIAPGKTLKNVPRYSWDHTSSYWFESRLSKESRFRKHGHHDLLGTRVAESTTLEPLWRNVLSLEDEVWLSDHKINENTIFPLAGYCAMVGEAIRQLTVDGGDTGWNGYCLSKVRVHTAMVLKEIESTEIVTALQRLMIDSKTPSESWTFMISSFTGSGWIRHCEGSVKAQRNEHPTAFKHKTFLREMGSSQWYEAMAQAGNKYGPKFQGLNSISSSAVRCEAHASITQTVVQRQATNLHPTEIDACFQVVLIAHAKGLGRNFTHTQVPVYIENLYVSAWVDSMRVTVTPSIGKGDSVFDIECGTNGQTSLQACGIELKSMEQDTALAGPDPHAGSVLEWRPHLNFTDHTQLFEPPVAPLKYRILLEEASLLCSIDTVDQLRGVETSKDHLTKYRNWLEARVKQAANEIKLLYKDEEHFLRLDPHNRTARIQQIFDQLSHMKGGEPMAIGIQRLWQNAERIFTGAIDALEVLMEDNVLTNIYNSMSFGHSGFISLLSHLKPNIRILEVGAGTGGTTQTFLRDLVDTQGLPQYAQYMFTDVSAGFFAPAKERFSYAPNLEFRVFDISKDPREQGLELASFDLILAANVVHATPVLKETLGNLRMLLKDDGYLVLTELTAEVKTPAHIFGHFAGWWLGGEDGRDEVPYISVDRWDEELKLAGYTGTDTVAHDAECPFQYSTIIVSRPRLDASPSATVSTACLTILCSEPKQSPARDIINAFTESHYAVSIKKLGEPLPTGQDILSILDLEGFSLAKTSEKDFAIVQNFFETYRSNRILWLTRRSQIACQHPEAAMWIGMARSVRAEFDTQLFTYEIDPTSDCFTESVRQVMEYVQTVNEDAGFLPDREFIFHGGFVKVGRYHPYSVGQRLKDRKAATRSDHCETELQEIGTKDTVSYVDKSETQPLGADEVRVQFSSAPLCREDVDGLTKEPRINGKTIGFELEIVGKVIALGKKVNGLAVNDNAMMLCNDDGAFAASSSVVVHSSLVTKVPKELSIADATMMALPFVTALYCLVVKADLERGQSVLVHGAAGMVGQAAIQICSKIGAEIYVTATGEDERQHLINALRIPGDRILDSKGEGFAQTVRWVTANLGYAVVLDTIGGDSLRKLWGCVASFGTLINIGMGKRNRADSNQLDVIEVDDNRSYHNVDMVQLIRQKPAVVVKLLKQMCEGVQKGQFSPFPHVANTDPDHVVSDSDRDRENKLVSAEEETITHTTRPFELSHLGSYLLTGGLGGIGKSLARWMVEKGARSISFLSPNAGLKDEDKSFALELESMGCSVDFQRGSVDVLEDVERTVANANGPVKGVVHLAMVLRDSSITSMTYADWNAVVQPKVRGALNLHRVFEKQKLDFFVLTSSLFSNVDRPGQCNYNAGNTFLQAFSQYRRRNGLPASVVGIGGVDGIGFFSRNAKLMKEIKGIGLYFLQERHVLEAIELAMITSSPTFTPDTTSDGDRLDSPWTSSIAPGDFLTGLRSTIPLDSPTNLVPWRRDCRMALYHNLSTQSSSSSTNGSGSADELSLLLASIDNDITLLDEESSTVALATIIGRKVADFTLRSSSDGDEISIDMDVASSGLDSLTAIELRRWWRRCLGFDISVLEINAAGSLRQLGRIAAEGLKAKLQENSG